MSELVQQQPASSLTLFIRRCEYATFVSNINESVNASLNTYSSFSPLAAAKIIITLIILLLLRIICVFQCHWQCDHILTYSKL